MDRERSTPGRRWRAACTAGLVLALLLTVACNRKRRYDGTCSEDAHCLESQRCNSGVCVRRAPLFGDRPVTAAQERAPVKPRPAPPKLEPLPAPPPPEPGPADRRTPTAPARRPPPTSPDDRTPVQLRLDA